MTERNVRSPGGAAAPLAALTQNARPPVCNFRPRRPCRCSCTECSPVIAAHQQEQPVSLPTYEANSAWPAGRPTEGRVDQAIWSPHFGYLHRRVVNYVPRHRQLVQPITGCAGSDLTGRTRCERSRRPHRAGPVIDDATGIDRTQATSVTSALLVRACPRILEEQHMGGDWRVDSVDPTTSRGDFVRPCIRSVLGGTDTARARSPTRQWVAGGGLGPSRSRDTRSGPHRWASRGEGSRRASRSLARGLAMVCAGDPWACCLLARHRGGLCPAWWLLVGSGTLRH